METLDAIKSMMEQSGIGPSKLSLAMGRSRNFVTSTISNGSTPRADTLANMARIMGYDLVLKGHGDEITITTKEVEHAHENQGTTDQLGGDSRSGGA